jgi:uncharacterized protein with PIN domain
MAGGILIVILFIFIFKPEANKEENKDIDEAEYDKWFSQHVGADDAGNKVFLVCPRCNNHTMKIRYRSAIALSPGSSSIVTSFCPNCGGEYPYEGIQATRELFRNYAPSLHYGTSD